MPEWISPDKERNFPFLTRSLYEKTSDEDEYNNCAAWAAGDTTRWWQPLGERWHFWPLGAPETFEISSYIRAYELTGFQLCADAIQEEGYEKIALYGYPNSLFSHAARLQEDGSWTSKLGKIEDIRHQNLAVLEGPHPAYGQVQCFMKRAMANP